MKLLLIGHRGVGKTSLLQRLQIYAGMKNQQVPVADLDKEIEKSVGRTVTEIFELVGEKAFRDLEIQLFKQMKKVPSWIISVGAGFPLDQVQIDSDIEVVWVQRGTDKIGRVFLDRPRLNTQTEPLTEFLERFEVRESLYADKANWIYKIPEGLSSVNNFERELFFSGIENCSGIWTLQKKNFLNFDKFIGRFGKMGLDYFEVRDDLLSFDQINLSFEKIKQEDLLFSFRNIENLKLVDDILKKGILFDWPIEYGKPDFSVDKCILSLHERNESESVEEAIKRLHSTDKKYHGYKLSIYINTFEELEVGLRWQMQDPEKRNFLPRSADGRWQWVRTWLKGKQKLNFIREGRSETPDQPTLYQWISTPDVFKSFSAVLGDPVDHSWTPLEQQKYFLFHQEPVLKIKISEAEWEKAMPVIAGMGLRCAAVTSPLKNLAFDFVSKSGGHNSELSLRLKSTNTLQLKDKVWYGHNTDLQGLKVLLESVQIKKPIAIWGGGGTLNTILEILPEAQAWSVRTSKPRQGGEPVKPTVVIWAAPPRAELFPADWQPELIIDLNYREDSRAKEYCSENRVRYVDGLMMFQEQAQGQREFWETNI